MRSPRHGVAKRPFSRIRVVVVVLAEAERPQSSPCGSLSPVWPGTSKLVAREKEEADEEEYEVDLKTRKRDEEHGMLDGEQQKKRSRTLHSDDDNIQSTSTTTTTTNEISSNSSSNKRSHQEDLLEFEQDKKSRNN